MLSSENYSLKYCVIAKKRAYLLRYTQKNSFSLQEFSSMADVSFLLLIFFIVVSSFVIPQGLSIDLPPKDSSNTVVVDEKDILEVYPKKKGFTINNKRYNSDTFDKVAKNAKQNSTKLICIIYMKKKLPYKRLIDTLNILKKNQIKKISLKSL